MYNCYICETQSHSVCAFRTHLQTHLILGELTCPITCQQGQCKSTFNKLGNFIRHLRQFHVVDGMLNSTSCRGSNTDTQADTNDVDACIESDDDLPVIHRINNRNHVENLQQEAVSMVAALRANSSIP